jgi:hypothetical protein
LGVCLAFGSRGLRRLLLRFGVASSKGLLFGRAFQIRQLGTREDPVCRHLEGASCPVTTSGIHLGDIEH